MAQHEVAMNARRSRPRGALSSAPMPAPASAPAAAPEDPILWDIIDEHLDEAAFVTLRWRAALDAPHYTLAQVGRSRETQLFAHLDALVIGGAAVAERRLRPELEAPDEPSFERSLV